MTCKCGCGMQTKIAARTSARDRTVKGEPMAYYGTHALLGRPPEVRLWGRVDKPDGDAGCWVWQGNTNSKGYGSLRLDGVTVGAHRAAYILTHGGIPDGLHIDHLCQNPPCVNPAHLEAVEPAENTRRIQDRQMACRRAGHDWTVAKNVYWNPTTGRRSCRTCAQELQNERRRAVRGASYA